MSMTINNQPADYSYLASILLPDSGTNVLVTGAIYPSQPTETAFTGSPLTAPTPPGSGSVYWIIEVNMSTAALDVQQSTSAMPAANPGCQIIFQQTLTPSTTDEALNGSDVTPDV